MTQPSPPPHPSPPPSTMQAGTDGLKNRSSLLSKKMNSISCYFSTCANQTGTEYEHGDFYNQNYIRFSDIQFVPSFPGGSFVVSPRLINYCHSCIVMEAPRHTARHTCHKISPSSYVITINSTHSLPRHPCPPPKVHFRYLCKSCLFHGPNTPIIPSGGKSWV